MASLPKAQAFRGTIRFAEYRIAARLYRAVGRQAAATKRAPYLAQGPIEGNRLLTRRKAGPYVSAPAQVAELVDALVSGTSGASRGGSSPLLGTTPSITGSSAE